MAGEKLPGIPELGNTLGRIVKPIRDVRDELRETAEEVRVFFDDLRRELGSNDPSPDLSKPVTLSDQTVGRIESPAQPNKEKEADTPAKIQVISSQDIISDHLWSVGASGYAGLLGLAGGFMFGLNHGRKPGAISRRQFLRGMGGGAAGSVAMSVYGGLCGLFGEASGTWPTLPDKILPITNDTGHLRNTVIPQYRLTGMEIANTGDTPHLAEFSSALRKELQEKYPGVDLAKTPLVSYINLLNKDTGKEFEIALAPISVQTVSAGDQVLNETVYMMASQDAGGNSAVDYVVWSEVPEIAKTDEEKELKATLYTLSYVNRDRMPAEFIPVFDNNVMTFRQKPGSGTIDIFLRDFSTGQYNNYSSRMGLGYDIKYVFRDFFSGGVAFAAEPIATPVPPPTVEPSPTAEQYVFTSSDWATVKEGENQGLVDPQIMFPLVGSINHKNRQFIDLSFGGLNVAYDTKQDLSQVTNHSQIREDAIKQLDLNAELKADLVKLINFLQEEKNKAVTERIVVQTDPSKFTVVIEDNKVTQIIERNGEQDLRRYVIDGDKNIRRLTKEEEPRLWSVLYVEGSKFMEEGSEVILRGAQTNHGVYDTPLDVFERDIDWMQENGANFVVIQWNSGFLNRPGYKDRIARMCELSKDKGFRVEFDLHSRGLKPGSSWDPQQITVVDDQIYNDWVDLLSDTYIANRLRNCVDIFVPISELDRVPGGNLVSWSTAKELEERIGKYIREKIQNPKAIIGFTPPSFGSDLRGVVVDPPNLPDSVVVVHPYQWTNDFSNFEANTNVLRTKGILVYVGEFGHEDPIPFIKKQYEFMVANRISFAVAAINSASDNPRGLYINGGQVTESGELASQYWKAEK